MLFSFWYTRILSLESNGTENIVRDIEKDILIRKKMKIIFLKSTHETVIKELVLWQPLVTKTNSNTSNKSLSRIFMWESQENSTRSLCCIPILFIQKSHGLC